MATKPEPIKLEVLTDHTGQGFYEGFNMSYVLNVRGIEVIVFMHDLDIYVMLPCDFEERGIVVRAEKDILLELREELGWEIKSIKLCTPNYH
jgi:hypothetical protein